MTKGGVEMDQGELYDLCVSYLKPGQNITLMVEEMKEAARRELTGIDFFAGSVSERELLEFTDKISKNWGVFIEYDRFNREFIIRKPADDQKK